MQIKNPLKNKNPCVTRTQGVLPLITGTIIPNFTNGKVKTGFCYRLGCFLLTRTPGVHKTCY